MGIAMCGGNVREVIPPLESFQKDDHQSDSSEYLEHFSTSLNTPVIQLYIKCSNLISENRFQLLNPMAEISLILNSKTEKTIETEVQSNTLNPIFQKTLKIPFSLDNNLSIFIQIFDATNKKNKSLIGSTAFSIHEIASRPDFVLRELKLYGKPNGNLLVLGKEILNFNTKACMRFAFRTEAQRKGQFFLRLSRISKTSSVPVFQTETKMAPSCWEDFEVNIGSLCRGDDTKKVLAEVVELGNCLNIIGNCKFSFSELDVTKSFQLSGSPGRLEIENFSKAIRETFLNIIRSGFEICPFYAIDFSEGFGHSSINLEQNKYLNFINEIHQTLQFYSQDPLYTVLGTGGKFENTSSPCFCFALNGNIFQPEVDSHQNLMAYYMSTYNSIRHSGQTRFSNTIETALKYIENELKETMKYYSLFIITAGDPEDFSEITEKYSKISELPLSIFIAHLNNDLLSYENLKTLKIDSIRPMIEVLTIDEPLKILQNLETHIVKYAEYKDLVYLKKREKIKNRSNSLKLSPEKIRIRSNYFTKAKAKYIEYLIQIGYPSQKIEEISQIGVPYILVDIKPKDYIPIRTRTIAVKQQSIKLQGVTCLGCSKSFSQPAGLPCGCQNLCECCAASKECTICKKKSI